MTTYELLKLFIDRVNNIIRDKLNRVINIGVTVGQIFSDPLSPQLSCS